jgi:glycosyltransferase involved in cell wall biosynthesis
MIHSPFMARSGGERQILKLTIELQKMGHEVEIFTSDIDRNTFPEFFDKVKINVIPHPLDGKLPPSWVPHIIPSKNYFATQTEVGNNALIKKWTERVQRFWLGFYYTNHLPYMVSLGKKIPKGFDIINNHNFMTEWAGFVAKNRLKVPLVWMCNEPPYWFFARDNSRFRKIYWPIYEILDRTTVEYIDEIMVLSHVAETYVAKAYGRSSLIVRTGVDTELIHYSSGENLRKKYNIENCFVMLIVGGSNYARRSDTIKTLAILSKKYDNIRLIIDTYREREMLTSLSEELGVKDKLLLFNSRNDQELSEVYAACDVFAYPSAASTWGLVVIEAMAAGKPVIVSKQIGASEIIQNRKNGIIVDKATPDEIAKQVEILMNDSQLRKDIGKNAYEYVKENLSWEKYAQRVENVFETVIGRSKTSL